MILTVLKEHLELKITQLICNTKTQHLPNLINKSFNVTLESHIANITSEVTPQTMTISYKISS